MALKPVSSRLIHPGPHNTVRHSRSVEKQYQGAIDDGHGLLHCFAMHSSKHRSADKPQLLSVVVDDDESVRESLPDLLRQFGFAARAFSSAKEFLSSGCVDGTSSLILDIAVPVMSGPELQQELKRRGQKIPIIFITGQGDETIRARLLKQGAAGFLLKPFSDADLLATIKAALPPVLGPTR
jgi:CheY-like chemotaxis protein